MTIELRHLRTFATLAEELHFGRTAARLHVVQSTVSQTLSALEDELGVSLVHRTRRRVALSPAGERYLEHAQAALAAVDRAADAARRVARGEAGTLRIHFTPAGALTALPRAIARFQREQPAVAIELEQAGSAMQAEAIREGRCDIGLVVSLARVEGLKRVSLRSDPLVTLVPRTHRLARRRKVRPREVLGEPLIMMSRRAEPELHALYCELCRREGVEPRIVIETEQLAAVLAFVAAGVGIAHAPSSVTQLQHRGVVAIPVAPRLDSGVMVIWDPQALSPVAERFLAVLWEEQRAQEP